jgi:DNA-binding NarL/FixJ family response regulator
MDNNQTMNQIDAIESDPRVINGKQLTSRQVEILIVLCSGRPYWQLGRMLGITEGSLKVYISRLKSVTGKNRTELALIGHRLANQRARSASCEGF